jgi:hypothetical protein
MLKQSITLAGRTLVAVALLIALVILPAIILPANSALAGQAVFNQTPETMDKAFGRYWTKLTQEYDGKPYVTYTYSPNKLRRRLPGYPASEFTMIYRDNRVQSVTFRPYKTAEDAKKQYDPLIQQEEVISSKMEEKLFEYLFGYRPSIYKPLYEEAGTAYSYTNCLGDGVASSYAVAHSTYLISGITLNYDQACEPPYERIKLTSTTSNATGG